MKTVFERKVWIKRRRPRDEIIKQDQDKYYERWRNYIEDQRVEMDRIKQFMNNDNRNHFRDTTYVRVIVSQYSRKYLHIVRVSRNNVTSIFLVA